jgi:CHAT domain-containing protein
VKPLAAHLDPKRILVIEPDSSISSIPFAALMDEHAFVGDRFAIVIASSAGDYLRRSRASTVRTATRALVVADPALGSSATRAFPPLRHAAAEGRAVAARFPASRILAGPEATSQSIGRYRRGVELLHFAGHGFSHAGNGGLLLAPGPGESVPEVLDGKKLAGQDWSRCRLALLSACSAGTGETLGPVNPESLVRRLLWAGIPRVVATSWRMDSAAGPDLMSRFYADIQSGVDVPRALRSALRPLRESARTRHPYHWAGFQTYGSR